ncbi:MAG TPA: chalcone isomerase family protein [Thermoanaerobaculia bacterium]|nr:chalcone isomerase family protein [Thermoanaerobaculia bacterium]
MKKLAAVAAALVLVALPLLAASVEGVRIPDTVTVGDKTLKLNGAGVRKKMIVRVYVCALYLENLNKDAAAIIASNETRSIRLHMMRAVEGPKISGAIVEGFENNSGSQMASLKERLNKLSKMIPNVKENDEIALTWIPDQGTVVNVRGTDTGTIEGRDFADALFSVWLGANPVQDDLKAALLAGGAS